MINIEDIGVSMFKKPFYFILMFCGVQLMYGAQEKDDEKITLFKEQQQKVLPSEEIDHRKISELLVDLKTELSREEKIRGHLFSLQEHSSNALREESLECHINQKGLSNSILLEMDPSRAQHQASQESQVKQATMGNPVKAWREGFGGALLGGLEVLSS